MNGGAGHDPWRAPIAERYACRKVWGVPIARRGWLLLVIALGVIAVGIVIAVFAD